MKKVLDILLMMLITAIVLALFAFLTIRGIDYCLKTNNNDITSAKKCFL